MERLSVEYEVVWSGSTHRTFPQPSVATSRPGSDRLPSGPTGLAGTPRAVAGRPSISDADYCARILAELGNETQKRVWLLARLKTDNRRVARCLRILLERGDLVQVGQYPHTYRCVVV